MRAQNPATLLVIVSVLAVAGAMPIAAQPSLLENRVAVKDLTWRDTSRDRDVPVRIYAPGLERGVGPFPLVVFSHGGGESREAFTYLGNHWAEHGYVTVFLTHRGTDRKAIEERGMRGMGGVRDFHLRPEDVRFVLDKLLSDDPDSELLRGRIDASRIAIAGQCAGSTTALAMVGLQVDLPDQPDATRVDRRFTCAIALSPQRVRDDRSCSSAESPGSSPAPSSCRSCYALSALLRLRNAATSSA